MHLTVTRYEFSRQLAGLVPRMYCVAFLIDHISGFYGVSYSSSDESKLKMCWQLHAPTVCSSQYRH